MAFLMAASSACDVCEGQLATKQAGDGQAAASPAPEAAAASLDLACSYLRQARAAAAALQAQQPAGAASSSLDARGLADVPGAGGDPKSDVYLLLLVSGEAAHHPTALCFDDW